MRNTEIAERLGHLRLPAGLLIKESEVGDYHSENVVCVATGSQGEPRSALSRIAADRHPHVKLEQDDVVIFSARVIPGNERPINKLVNHIVHHGTEVIREGRNKLHVSGHGSVEELKLMLSLVRPRYFVPIHGEYRNLVEHARVASNTMGNHSAVLVAEDGDVIHLGPDVGYLGNRVPVGRILIDEKGACEVSDDVLRQRRRMASDGIVVAIIAVDKTTGNVERPPSFVTRGIVIDERTTKLLEQLPELVTEVIDGSSDEERFDRTLLNERVRTEVRRLFRKQMDRKPLVVPLLMEI